MNFEYGEKEIEYLCGRDPAMAEATKLLGRVDREVWPVFAGLCRNIISQQISSAALDTVWARFCASVGDVTPENVLRAGLSSLRSTGLSEKKAAAILNLSYKIEKGEFDLDALAAMSDEDATQALVSLSGVGEWTAEMTLLFCLERPDVLSYRDFGIKKGLCLLHGLENLDKETFERFRSLYSPYGSVASIYLWEIARRGQPVLCENVKNCENCEILKK